MLSRQKYGALVNIYGSNEETKAMLKEMGCINVGEVVREEMEKVVEKYQGKEQKKVQLPERPSSVKDYEEVN